MMPLVGAKESEEVVVRRIVRRLERYFEELEGQLKNKQSVRTEFSSDGGSTATSNQFAEGPTPEMQFLNSTEQDNQDDLDAPTVRRPPPLPEIKHDPEFPKAPPLPKIVEPPPPPPVFKVTTPPVPVITQSSSEADPSQSEPSVSDLGEEPVPEHTPEPIQERSPVPKPVPDAAVSLLFQGRPTPFHKTSNAANAGLIVAIAFVGILVCLLVLYVFMGPDFRSH
jgi:hypothetical protein